MPSELKVNTITEATSGSGITFAKDVIPATPLSHRNLIINGAMQVAQRGTSFTGVGNGDNGYYLDRFEFIESGSPNGEFTITRSTDTPNGFGNSMKFDCTTDETSLDSSERIILRQRIEGQNLQALKKGTSDAEKVTLSFYVKSNLTGTAVVGLYDHDNSRYIAKSYTIDSADTWERKTITFEGDTTGTLDNDNAVSIEVQFYLQAGNNFTSGTLATAWESFTEANAAVGQTINIASSTDNDFFITGVQLELGSVATPFEHRSYAEELQRCQRYYHTILTLAASSGVSAYIMNGNATARGSFQLATTMRAAGTLVESHSDIVYRFNGTNSKNNDSTIPTIDLMGDYGGTINFGGFTSLPTAGQAGVIRITTGTSGAHLALLAEL